MTPACDDIVSATELRQNASAVMDRAEAGPVIITRQGEPPLALVSRQHWTNTTQSSHWLKAAAFVARYYLARHEAPGDPPHHCPSEYSWLRAFDHEDSFEFMDEMFAAIDSAMAGVRPWSDVENIFNEWHRSALYILDPELSARLKDAKKLLTSELN